MATQSSGKTLSLPIVDHTPQPYQGPTRDEVLALRQQYVSPGVITYYKEPLMVVEGHMQYVYDETGKRYLDAIAGIVTISVGLYITSFFSFPVGIDGFDNDTSGTWTFGDDLHLEDPAGTCPTGIRAPGVHDLGLDCVVLDLNASLFNGQPVSCDFESGTFCPGGFLTGGATGDLTFFDSSGNGFYDAGVASGNIAEDIVLDVNANGFFD